MSSVRTQLEKGPSLPIPIIIACLLTQLVAVTIWEDERESEKDDWNWEGEWEGLDFDSKKTEGKTKALKSGRENQIIRSNLHTVKYNALVSQFFIHFLLAKH